ETGSERRRVELDRIVRDMNELQLRRRQQTLREIATSVDVRKVAQIDAGEVQEIEAHHDHGRFALRLRDFIRRLELRAILQRVERRTPVRTERDELTVDDHRVDGLLTEALHDFWEPDSQVDAAT